MPSDSSPVKPLELHKPSNLVAEQRLLEVAALSLRQETLSALETVLRAEQQFHLEAAAFSPSADRRLEHRGIYCWIKEWLDGSTLARYAEQARQRLALHDTPDGVPKDGTEWMESDGMVEE